MCIALPYSCGTRNQNEPAHANNTRQKRQGAGQFFLNVPALNFAGSPFQNFSIPINTSDPNAVRATPAPATAAPSAGELIGSHSHMTAVPLTYSTAPPIQ
jgi:hypothetical protein